jgi:DNA polymerase III subunit beta
MCGLPQWGNVVTPLKIIRCDLVDTAQTENAFFVCHMSSSLWQWCLAFSGDSKMRSVTLFRNDLMALSRLAPKNDIRFYLNGLMLEIGAMTSRLVATDGHILGVLHLQDLGDPKLIGHTEQHIIPIDVIAKLKPKKRSDNKVEFIINDPDKEGNVKALARFDGEALEFNMINGVYPNYRKVITKQAAGGVVQIDPELLVRFKKAVIDLGDSNGWMQVTPNATSSSYLTCFDKRFFAVVMAWLPNGIVGRPLPYDAPDWVHHPIVPPTLPLLLEMKAAA